MKEFSMNDSDLIRDSSQEEQQEQDEQIEITTIDPPPPPKVYPERNEQEINDFIADQCQIDPPNLLSQLRLKSQQFIEFDNFLNSKKAHPQYKYFYRNTTAYNYLMDSLPIYSCAICQLTHGSWWQLEKHYKIFHDDPESLFCRLYVDKDIDQDTYIEIGVRPLGQIIDLEIDLPPIEELLPEKFALQAPYLIPPQPAFVICTKDEVQIKIEEDVIAFHNFKEHRKLQFDNRSHFHKLQSDTGAIKLPLFDRYFNDQNERQNIKDTPEIQIMIEDLQNIQTSEEMIDKANVESAQRGFTMFIHKDKTKNYYSILTLLCKHYPGKKCPFKMYFRRYKEKGDFYVLMKYRSEHNHEMYLYDYKPITDWRFLNQQKQFALKSLALVFYVRRIEKNNNNGEVKQIKWGKRKEAINDRLRKIYQIKKENLQGNVITEDIKVKLENENLENMENWQNIENNFDKNNNEQGNMINNQNIVNDEQNSIIMQNKEKKRRKEREVWSMQEIKWMDQLLCKHGWNPTKIAQEFRDDTKILRVKVALWRFRDEVTKKMKRSNNLNYFSKEAIDILANSHNLKTFVNCKVKVYFSYDTDLPRYISKKLKQKKLSGKTILVKSKLYLKCYACNIMFHSILAQSKHNKTHNHIFKCSKCKKTFKFNTILKQHLHKCRLSTCHQCSHTFPTLKTLIHHKNNSHSLTCSSSIQPKVNFLKSTDQPQKKCFICGQKLSHTYMAEHLQMHQNVGDNFKCRFCEKKYVSALQLMRHCMVQHPEVYPQFQKCKKCTNFTSFCLNHKDHEDEQTVSEPQGESDEMQGMLESFLNEDFNKSENNEIEIVKNDNLKVQNDHTKIVEKKKKKSDKKQKEKQLSIKHSAQKKQKEIDYNAPEQKENIHTQKAAFGSIQDAIEYSNQWIIDAIKFQQQFLYLFVQTQ